jgi:two-component system, OmpR family, response regulator MprA
VKPFETEELLARVRALLRRGREPAELLACGDLVFEVATRVARRGGREIALSAREADLLELLLVNQRQVVTRETALARVWGSAHGASSNSVDRYVSYLRRKLGEPSLIETVRGTGFVLGR